MKLRSLLPKSLKLQFRIAQRILSDKNVDFASSNTKLIPFLNSITTSQEIKQGTFFENKTHNIKKASNNVALVQLLPNQIFSFWKIVGSPNEKNGFKKGRNIVNGKISEEIGGGLCQLSSIIYITALKANLEIVERYNHSVDIYKEEERFTPLGSDATVVYGYKDLRIKNNFNFPIQFAFSFEDNNIICKLESLEKIHENNLDFIRNYEENSVKVETKINLNHHCFSSYTLMEL
jgi:vancomycin resistance protein VanW